MIVKKAKYTTGFPKYKKDALEESRKHKASINFMRRIWGKAYGDIISKYVHNQTKTPQHQKCQGVSFLKMRKYIVLFPKGEPVYGTYPTQFLLIR